MKVQRAASDVMQSILLSAVIDALEGMKTASKGVPNLMLRDLQSIHRNTTFADLPKPVQDSIAQSVRAAFTQLLKEGYAVGPKQEMQQSRPLDRVPERDRRAPADRRDFRKGPGRRGPSGGPGGGGRPGGRPGGGRPGGGRPGGGGPKKNGT
jgi:hypothetical protein